MTSMNRIHNWTWNSKKYLLLLQQLIGDGRPSIFRNCLSASESQTKFCMCYFILSINLDIWLFVFWCSFVTIQSKNTKAERAKNTPKHTRYFLRMFNYCLPLIIMNLMLILMLTAVEVTPEQTRALSLIRRWENNSRSISISKWCLARGEACPDG